MGRNKEENNKIRAYILANPKYLTGYYSELAAAFNVTLDRVQHLARKLRSNPEYQSLIETVRESKPEEPIKEPEPTLPKHDILLRRKSAELTETKRKYDLLIKDFDEVESLLDIVSGASETPITNIPIISGNDDIKSEATALAIFSDFHLAERVDPNTVHGLNETNPDIMQSRVIALTQNLIKLVNKERQGVVIDNLVLALLGDFLNAFLHEHDRQENYMTPVEELVFARDVLIASIQYILDNGNFKKIDVPCMRGNHPRSTFKMSSSTDYKMNLEAVLYNMLDKHFSNDPRIEFHIPQSELGYIKVYGKTIRYFHGHQIKYQGGIGGLTISLNKQLLRWDQNRQADLNIFGHFHELSYPTKNSILNGSLIGYNSYANSLGFRFEPPQQAFQLIDKEHGFTIKAPIFSE